MPLFDDMELDFAPPAMSDEEILEADLATDTANFEGERCGLCMDLIVDRGVLDCCQHWFCFTCIDNWATITNLCPLCQSEFQLITCVPVYDTIGNSKFEEEPVSREDDWCIEGKNNTLSFPSYYIDENAVVCLDGDGCKVRSGSASAEGDSYLDTSIACDSCDIWYHASCVGFDPEGTSENTWLCPRCVAHQMQNAPSVASLQESGNLWCPGDVGCDYVVEDALSGKVSVAFADAGETAIVVSMVPKDLQIEMPNESPLNIKVDEAIKGESMVLVSDANISKEESETVANTATDPESATQNAALSLLQDTLSVMPPTSFAFSELKPNNDENVANEPSTSGFQDVMDKLFSESHLGMNTSEWQNTDGTKIETEDVPNNHTSQDVTKTTLMEDSTLDAYNTVSAYNTAPDAEKVPVTETGAKKKHTNSCDTAESKAEIKTEVAPKKGRVEEKVEAGCFEDQTDTLVSDDTEKCTILLDGADKLTRNQETPPDIMNIVKGMGRKSSTTDKPSARGENAGGLRIKKIMRTAGKDNESSFLVQKLRTEIREAVQNKSSKDFEENLCDAKLLAAFRAVIAGPTVEPVKKLSSLAVKAKKSLMQKGKVRESLTKKIYGTSNGKRKRAWDRDCEVEFWKYRCMRTTKPEKIETLKSVLGLLRGNSTNLEMMQEPDQPSTDSILSRLYLADTSVLPRKDNIKPLSYLDDDSEQKKEQINPERKSVDHATKSAESNKDAYNSGSSAKHGIKVPSSKHNPPISKLPAGRPEKSSASQVSSSNCGRGKDMVSKSDDLKRDKRKWALEILARKTASAGKGASSDEHEDDPIFKGNFPLLAQLPKDMRPILASTHHNKVPKSVRQKQLYRLTEHFLRNVNLQTICRTAETELAVADAINIERELADRSNSKLIYLNLCSQEIMHCTENGKSSGAIEPTPLSPLAVSTEKLEQGTEEYSDSEVEVALRAAGLLSDSPPSTPSHTIGVLGGEMDPSAEAGDEMHDQAGRDSEIDINGEFEHNLGDKNYVGNGSMKVSKQPEEEEEEGFSKMKEVFSSSNPENLDHALDSKSYEVPLSKCCERASIRTSPVEDVASEPSDSHKLPCDVVGEQSSVQECEESCEPDKEPLMNSEGVGRTECDLTDTESRKGIGVPGDVNTCGPSQEVEQSAGVITLDKSSGGKRSSSSVSQDSKFEQEDREKHDKQRSDNAESIKRKVEAYIKEHIRPLCKSGVISVEQYRWAVAKSVEKVMKHHLKAKNASFLIKEGEKVKRLAEQYVEASQQRGKTD